MVRTQKSANSSVSGQRQQRGVGPKGKVVRSTGLVKYPQVGLPTNRMMEQALHKNLPHVPPLKYLGNDLLDLSIPTTDPRAQIMERNVKESMLLALSPELRIQIMEYVIGYHHIHITRKPLLTTTSFVSRSAITTTAALLKNEPEQRETTQYRTWTQKYPDKFYNYVYPLDWKDYYRSSPVFQTLAVSLEGVCPDNRVIKPVDDHMTIIGGTCRQIYKEIALIPYSTNEFSFDSPYTMQYWLDNRWPDQLRAMKVLWIDLEWKSTYVERNLNNLSPTGTIFKVSRLAWRTAIAEWRSKSHPARYTDFDRLAAEERGFERWIRGRFPLNSKDFLGGRYVIEFID
ncbi:hypothetical protein CC78DRAFT_611619 [Lojkania enalia]|uniref:Uncharacterized protein n=1 Tax=Lojkania enalia TaxID=147567 RepID=A0A9P4TR99_9PLEO|nr:hypothetical protein CC78DRAFT_611619 [Didymosphaeria enalia]